MDNNKLDPQLNRRLQANPQAGFRLIVRVTGDLEARSVDLARRGLSVYRRLSLIGALAVRGTGAQALALRDEPWVSRIEEDREVRAVTPEVGESGRGPAGGGTR